MQFILVLIGNTLWCLIVLVVTHKTLNPEEYKNNKKYNFGLYLKESFRGHIFILVILCVLLYLRSSDNIGGIKTNQTIILGYIIATLIMYLSNKK